MFTVQISTANEAFDDPAPELGRILRKLAAELETSLPHDEETEGRLVDINGNTVGKWQYV